jgi:hypothetical protein
MYRLTGETIEKGIEKLLGDKTKELSACLDAIYGDMEGMKEAEEYHQKHMTPSYGVITVYDSETALAISKAIAMDIANKVVIEIGAGVGILACAMATIAKQVYAIESDPAWAWGFTKVLYGIKPTNLTWIFGKAESMVDILHGDVAVIVTRSGHKEMQVVGSKLATKVIDVYKGLGMDSYAKKTMDYELTNAMKHKIDMINQKNLGSKGVRSNGRS